jgi:lysozyme
MSGISRRDARAVVLGCALLACGGFGAAGCSSEDDAPHDGCVGESAAALRTCAAGATLKGVDVSYYQGTVDWTKVKSSGHSFAFVRVSDGLSYPDTKFATNWPAVKKAGVVRGLYQYFRPNQDVQQQVDLLFTKLNAAGGITAGDLPPVLDLETDGGLAASTVVARAKDWLAKVEAKLGVKPIVYTAAFMSSTIGTSFGGYTLWVANYGATCPLMPSGWSNWSFWQNADNGSVSGIGGSVDTNFFNGDGTKLSGLTLKPSTSTPSDPGKTLEPEDTSVVRDDPHPVDGSQGGTLGDGNKNEPPSQETAAAPLDPCAR